MKTSAKKMIKLSIILYGVLLCAALVTALGWFVLDRTAGIESAENMTITAGSNLEISLDGEHWDQKQTPTLSHTCPDITGDGINFWYPNTLDENDTPLFGSPDTFLNINAIDDRFDRSQYYVDVVLHFKTSGNSAVYLQKTSTVQPMDPDTNDAMGGEMPNDAIAGAVRVAFYEIPRDRVDDPDYQPAAADLKCIWIPNDKYEIYGTTQTDEDGNTVNGFAFTDNGTREDSYGYLAPVTDGDGNRTFDVFTWSAEDYASGKVLVGSALAANTYTNGDGTVIPAMTHGAVPLLDFGDSTGMTEKTMLIRIWIEGTDREAHTYLNSGDIQYTFDFITIEKEDSTLKTVTYANGDLAYADGSPVATGELLYSYDGIAWAPYSTTNHPGLTNDLYTDDNGDQVLFVKLAETAAAVPSAYQKVVIIPASSG